MLLAQARQTFLQHLFFLAAVLSRGRGSGEVVDEGGDFGKVRFDGCFGFAVEMLVGVVGWLRGRVRLRDDVDRSNGACRWRGVDERSDGGFGVFRKAMRAEESKDPARAELTSETSAFSAAVRLLNSASATTFASFVSIEESVKQCT